MRSTKRAFNRRMIAGIAWFGAFLLVAYIYWLVMTNFVVRDFWDPTYVQKLELLKARMAHYPGRPLWLVFGSSHVLNAVAPDIEQARTSDGKSPLLFNFGITSSDLFYQSICLRRVLKEGIVPARIGIEFDMLINNNYSMFVESPWMVPRARRDELEVYRDYSKNPGSMRLPWLESRWNPFFECGMKAPGQALPLRLVPLLSRFEKRFMSPWGWLNVPVKPHSKEEFDAMMRDFSTHNDMIGREPIPPNADRALRGLIALCHDRGISLFLLRMPQAADARTDNPQAMAVIQSYLDKISSDNGVQVIDARAWVTDEGFFDLHHVNGDGAEQFTRKLTEVLDGNKSE